MKHTGVVVHCSASDFGDVKWINDIHVNERKWDEIGYHFVITNNRPNSKSTVKGLNGQVSNGRALGKYGAHAKGYNDKIGICLIGDKNFSLDQINALVKLICDLQDEYGFTTDDIIGHYECKGTTKECPNINMDIIRWLVSQKSWNG